MSFSNFPGRAARARQASSVRRTNRNWRPELEQVESRELLTGVPYILIDSPHVLEGTGGLTPMTFTVNLSGPSTTPVTVNYRTFDRTTTAGSDYIPVSGTLTFAPGETAKPITVQVIGDSTPELSEAFGMLLSGATNSIIANSVGTGTILDDDTAVTPLLSINDVQIRRGLSGSKTMLFTVSLNTTLSYPVTVTASTRNLTALAGVDYQATSQQLTFAAGVQTVTFAVTIYGSTDTTSKYFFVDLTGASVGLNRGTGTGILNYGA